MNSNTNLNAGTDRVTYDPATEGYRGQSDWERSDHVSLTVVETVSAVAGKEPDAMEPLYSILDPDALETILASPQGGFVRLSFSYEGCSVTLTSTGEIVVRPDE
ncbi:HalOD1 output domain-containing protein [Halorussus caseinilyticus]|uniref:HalOD1 output domain-containing protein n=1 Tax=Halorussus caseinilyticus TaxID=3034025 RepID=A0ABD5WS21_9EURY|nr:HalOD1 output domain-containing protein [Halorussus sp. DT72]